MKPVLLLYDATCRFCTESARQAAWLRPRGGLRRADVNDPRIQARYRITPAAVARALHLVTPTAGCMWGRGRYICCCGAAAGPGPWRQPGPCPASLR